MQLDSANTEQQLVVFVHGWSCRASDWDATIAALAPQLPSSWQCLAPSLPGHIGAEQEACNDWSIPGLARALCAKLPEQLPVTLVGHSMGGCVALEAAAQLGERVKHVILVDTFGLPYGDMDAATIDSIERPFNEDFVGAMQYLVDNTTPANLDPGIRDGIKARMASARPELMLPIWHQLLRWSPDAAFTAIHCPISALNGEHIPAPAQARCAPYVNAQVLAGCHHFPQFEQPAAFQAALSKLLLPIPGL